MFAIAIISAVLSGLLGHFIATKFGFNVPLWRALGVIIGPVVVLSLLLIFKV